MKTLFRWILVLLIGLVLSLAVTLRSFHVFTREELVAVIECHPAPKEATYSFVVKMTPMEGGIPGRTEAFPMGGDQWSIGGDILKWRLGLTLLGLKSLHKLTRLNSRYSTADQERSQPRWVYDLNGGTALLWRWLYRSGVRLPWVDAVYGNSIYVPIRANGRWGVYVTHTGYLVRPLRRIS